MFQMKLPTAGLTDLGALSDCVEVFRAGCPEAHHFAAHILLCLRLLEPSHSSGTGKTKTEQEGELKDDHFIKRGYRAVEGVSHQRQEKFIPNFYERHWLRRAQNGSGSGRAKGE